MREIVLPQGTTGTIKDQIKPCKHSRKNRRAKRQATCELWHLLHRSQEITCAKDWGTIAGGDTNGGISTLSPTHLPKVKQNKQKAYEVPTGLIHCPYTTFSSLLFEDNRWFISVTQIHALILKPRLRTISRSMGYLFSQE